VPQRVALLAVGSAATVAAFSAAPGAAHTGPEGGIVPARSYVAYARGGTIAIYSSERASRPWRTLASGNADGARLSFLVRSLHRRRAWVYLPTRPNGSSGWVNRSQVRFYSNPYRLRIDLRAHRLTVWKLGRLFYETPVGVGRAVTPTPAGTYYVVSRIRPLEPNSVYGAFAFGLSAHSNVFARFGFGGDGRIGLHGTNDVRGVGRDVSHGCIRMRNRAILRLSRLLALGTPVVITRA
jgi:lipoprotein-anchoring transpeptidase ErfK/SrfK